MGPESNPVSPVMYYMFWSILSKHSTQFLEPIVEGSQTIQHEYKDWIGKQAGTEREDSRIKES